MTRPLAKDPRWQRMLDADWACPCCGQRFGGIMDIGYDHPDSWPYGNRQESGEETSTRTKKQPLLSYATPPIIHCIIFNYLPLFIFHLYQRHNKMFKGQGNRGSTNSIPILPQNRKGW